MHFSRDLNHGMHAAPAIGPITASARFQYFSRILSERWPHPPRIPTMLDLSGDAGFLAGMFAGLGFRVTVAEGPDADIAAPREKFDVVCCCDRLEHRDDWRAVLSRIAPMIRTGGVLFYSVVGHAMRSRSVLGRVREWFGAPLRDHAITASDLAGKLGQQGFRVREVRSLSQESGYRGAAGPISYMGYAFRLSDRPRMPRAERRLQPGSTIQPRSWSVRVQHPPQRLK